MLGLAGGTVQGLCGIAGWQDSRRLAGQRAWVSRWNFSGAVRACWLAGLTLIGWATPGVATRGPGIAVSVCGVRSVAPAVSVGVHRVWCRTRLFGSSFGGRHGCAGLRTGRSRRSCGSSCVLLLESALLALAKNIALCCHVTGGHGLR